MPTKYIYHITHPWTNPRKAHKQNIYKTVAYLNLNQREVVWLNECDQQKTTRKSKQN